MSVLKVEGGKAELGLGKTRIQINPDFKIQIQAPK
jgi:hypothetical protein